MDLAQTFSDLAISISAQFGGPYVSGEVIDQGAQSQDSGGSIVATSAPVKRPCAVQIDKATQEMQAAEGYVRGDMSFQVLAATLNGALDTDAIINVLSGPHSGKWAVSGIALDSLGIYWAGSGRRA